MILVDTKSKKKKKNHVKIPVLGIGYLILSSWSVKYLDSKTWQAIVIVLQHSLEFDGQILLPKASHTWILEYGKITRWY